MKKFLSLALILVLTLVTMTAALADATVDIAYKGEVLGAYDPITGETVWRDGAAWLIDEPTKTMAWIGPNDGTCDIHQGVAPAIEAIRNGYEVTFITTVPGQLLLTIGTVDGVKYNNETLIELAVGEHVVTDSIGLSGGFRWTPNPGIGWRAK